MIIEGQLLLPDRAHGVRLAHGQVRLQGDKLAEISVFSQGDRRLGRADLGSEHALVCPGFIDAHLHVPQFDAIGVDGLTLLDWLNTAVFPAESRWSDADYAGETGTRVARRLLAAGTTGVAAYASVHHHGTRSAMRALGAAGLRGVVGQVLMDQNAPAEIIRPVEQLLKEAATFRPGEFGRIDPAVTPRFAVSCSDDLLKGAGELARRTGWMVQTHLSEMLPECHLVQELHGAGYVEVYRRAGLLTPRTILGHGIWLDGADRTCLREAGSVIAHCPTANLFLQAGRFDRDAVLGNGVPVALGSDVAGGPDVCMVRVARAMIETAKTRRLGSDGHVDGSIGLPSPAMVWHQITAGNADALGWNDAGRLHAGAAADMVVIEPGRGPNAERSWLSTPDPLGRLLYAWDERWIAATVAAGRLVYQAA